MANLTGLSLYDIVANLSRTNNALANSIRPSDIWIGDLLFVRQNCSLKYTEDGEVLILAESPSWADLRSRLVHSLGWLCVQLDAILLNFLLLLLSFRKTKQQAFHKKVQFLLANLAICNICLALGLLVYTFLVDVWFEVDSFDTLLRLDGHLGANLWPFSKFLIHTELVENFFCVQQLVLLLASFDRYLTLFERYSPHARHKLLLTTICLLPYFVALFLMDRHFLRLWMGQKAVNILRILGLLCPLLLSLVFCACSILGLLQQRRLLRRLFGPLFREELSLSSALLAILCIDAIAKLGLFLELLGANFSIRVTTGTAKGDAQLGRWLDRGYSLAHFLLLLSPLLQALICLLWVSFYRRRLASRLRRLLRCCQRPQTLDYSCETMRSIIAEQTRARQQRGARAHWGMAVEGEGSRGGGRMGPCRKFGSTAAPSLPRRK